MNGVCDGHRRAPVRSSSREPTAGAQLVESLHLQPLWILWPSCPHPHPDCFESIHEMLEELM